MADLASDHDPNIIQSLSRGLAALELIAEHSMTPRTLAEALGVDRSTAYRILCTLAHHGFVERDPFSDQYIISSRKILTMGSTVSANLHWPSLAMPWLRQLRDQTGEAVNLAVLQNDEMVYVSHLPGSETITVGPMLGVRRPVYCSAVGKAVAAYLPDSDREQLLQRLKLTPLTLHTITDRERLWEALQRVKAQGYAVDDEETFQGVRCVAAPIHDQSGQVIAAIGLSGPGLRVTLDRIPALGALVRSLAGEFSASLGAPRPEAARRQR